MSKIIYSDYYSPSTTVHVKEILGDIKTLDIPDHFSDKDTYIDKFIESSGIKRITFEVDASLIEIFTQQLTTLFNETKIKPEQIKNLIFTSYKNYKVSRDVSVPAYLLEKFNLSQASFMLVYQQCASTIRAIEIAKGFHEKDKECYSLILSPSLYRSLEERVTSITICGDGAGVLLVGKDNTTGVFEMLESAGISCGAPSIASRKWNLGARKKEEKMKANIKLNADYKKLIESVFKKQNININDIEIFLFQSVSLSYCNFLSTVLGIPKNKIYPIDFSHGGHWSDTDFIRNYTDVIKKFKFRQGDYMLSLFGGADNTALSINVSLFRYC